MIETGIFYNRQDAEEAVRLLHELGYRDAEISKITSNRNAGCVEGEISGALIDVGIPKQRARDLEAGVMQGGVIIGVTPRDRDRRRVETILAPSETKRVRSETGVI